MKNFVEAVAVFAMIVGLNLMVMGCSSLGNGRLDPFGEGVSLAYYDGFGNGFEFVEGELAAATYRSMKTHVLYQYTTDTGSGTFWIKDQRTGVIVRLRRAEVQDLTAEERGWLIAGEADLKRVERLIR